MTPGTTVEAAAGAIARSALRNLHVVTNSTVAAEILGKNGNISIVVTGGVWQANNHALAGSAAAELAGRCRCDVLLTSIGAIDADGSLLEFRDEEVAVARSCLPTRADVFSWPVTRNSRRSRPASLRASTR